MRKLIACWAALALIAVSALVAYAAPRFNTLSGCQEPSQLMSCLNQAIGGVFNSGSSGNLNVTVSGPALTAGTGGASGLVQVVPATLAINAPATVNITDPNINAGALCLASVVGSGGTAGIGVGSVVVAATAPQLVITLISGTNVAFGGSNTATVAWWCFQ
jgi:hypothetical protein